MKLLLDIGNSRIKWAWAESGRVSGDTGALPHSGAVPEALFAAWSAWQAPAGVLAVSVSAPAIERDLGEWVQRHWACELRSLSTPPVGGGIRIAYPRPETLGADRWAAMVGARQRGLLPACVVDCGTAVTLDAVDASGNHLGGLIAPGLATMRCSLTERAHRLPVVGEGDIWLLATDTPTGIRSGTLLGLAALIDGLVGRLTEESGLPLRPLLTGGDARQLHSWFVRRYEHFPDLVLEGLAVLAEEGS